MTRMAAAAVFSVTLLFVSFAGCGDSTAQEFPYLAPSAPEFDENGRHVNAKAEAAPSQRAQAGGPPPPAAQAPTARAGTSNPAIVPVTSDGRPKPPDAPGFEAGMPKSDLPSSTRRASTYAARTQSPNYSRTPRPTATPAAVAPSPGSAANSGPAAAQQPQAKPDCSTFPVRLAGVKSEAEMQAVSREFLTCLLQTGWNMEQAREYVIRTIESTFGVAQQK
ncbi:MAG: hypothetical protein V2B18_14820 [Pseudomonadota bacterium]